MKEIFNLPYQISNKYWKVKEVETVIFLFISLLSNLSKVIMFLVAIS